jgi:hypothetical protein
MALREIYSSTEGNSMHIPRIPHEILSAIFIACQSLGNPPQIYGYHPKSLLRCDLPVEILLTHVSHFWRNVAIDTSALWIAPPTIFPCESTNLCKIYLDRSNTQTIALAVDFTDRRRHAAKMVHDPMAAMRLVSENLGRYHRLRVSSERDKPVVDS